MAEGIQEPAEIRKRASTSDGYRTRLSCMAVVHVIARLSRAALPN
jgi:hypothetical protein